MASNARPFIVRPAAEADIEEAALWYELRSLGLGADFLRAVGADSGIVRILAVGRKMRNTPTIGDKEIRL